MAILVSYPDLPERVLQWAKELHYIWCHHIRISMWSKPAWCQITLLSTKVSSKYLTEHCNIFTYVGTLKHMYVHPLVPGPWDVWKLKGAKERKGPEGNKPPSTNSGGGGGGDPFAPCPWFWQLLTRYTVQQQGQDRLEHISIRTFPPSSIIVHTMQIWGPCLLHTILLVSSSNHELFR